MEKEKAFLLWFDQLERKDVASPVVSLLPWPS